MNSAINDRKIFCLGLSKTGTTSFGELMRRCGLNHESGPGKIGLLSWKFDRMDVLQSIIENHDSFSDLPWPFLYRQTMNSYPDAWFVLTTRSNSEIWLKSLEKHWERRGASQQLHIAYGITGFFGQEEKLKQLYEKHNDDVRRFFKGSDQMVEVCVDEEGWSCKVAKHAGLNYSLGYDPHSNTHSGRTHEDNIIKLLNLGRYGHAVYYIDKFCENNPRAIDIMNEYINNLSSTKRQKQNLCEKLRSLVCCFGK